MADLKMIVVEQGVGEEIEAEVGQEVGEGGQEAGAGAGQGLGIEEEKDLDPEAVEGERNQTREERKGPDQGVNLAQPPGTDQSQSREISRDLVRIPNHVKSRDHE